MVNRFSPLLDKFNLPVPEQSHYDVIMVFIASSVAKQGYLRPGTKNIFAPQPTKTAEFEVKNRRKSAEKTKV